MNVRRIQGDTVSLCTFRTDDEAVTNYVKWMADQSTLNMLGSPVTVQTFTSEKKWAETVAVDRKDLHFNIVVNATDTLIGNCDIDVSSIHRDAGIGILIGDKSSRGCGYGTEVMRLMLKFCFEELNTHRVHLSVRADNTAGIKCYTKVGFTVCGRESETVWYGGKWHDTLRMEILEQNYFERMA